MRIAAEISMYPLNAHYIPPIRSFIDALNAHPDITVTTNAMSTQVAGEHARVFEILAQETAAAFAAEARAVFVIKVIGGAASTTD